jgi:DNA-binding PadR family transcriptional regulator
MARSSLPALTEYESIVLAIIARDGPATAYKVRKVLESSPAAGISSSAGAVYPAVARLKARNFIISNAVDADGRNTELLTATENGRAAIRRWIMQVTPEQVLPIDPLRSRVAHAHMLSSKERRAWLRTMREALQSKLTEIEAYAERHSEGKMDYAHRHATRITRARIAWIDDIIALETA